MDPNVRAAVYEEAPTVAAQQCGHTAPPMTPEHKALVEAEASFEKIRTTLVNHLNEPERSAFWEAVDARDKIRESLYAQCAQPANPAQVTDADRKAVERGEASRAEAPEKIWAYHNGNSQTYLTAPNKFHNVEFVRADIAASQLAEARAEAERWAAQALKEEECRIAWQAERDRLAAENAQFREALEPFAQVAEYDIGENEGDGDIYRHMDAKYAVARLPRVGDFRRARAALASVKGD